VKSRSIFEKPVLLSDKNQQQPLETCRETMELRAVLAWKVPRPRFVRKLRNRRIAGNGEFIRIKILTILPRGFNLWNNLWNNPLKLIWTMKIHWMYGMIWIWGDCHISI
jgi:hypothetical protein